MKRYFPIVALAMEATTAALGRLNPRERRLVTLFGALLALSLVYVGLIEPIVDGRYQMQRRIDVLSRDLDTLQDLAARIRLLEGDLGRKKNPTNTSKNFSLFSFIDRATAASVTADAIASCCAIRSPAFSS